MAEELRLFNKDGSLDWAGAGRRLPAVVAFVVTAVPFYHGMARHLARTYIERDVPESKSGFLLLDFFVFFVEACILLAFSSLVGVGNNAFLCLMALLVFDSIWAMRRAGRSGCSGVNLGLLGIRCQRPVGRDTRRYARARPGDLQHVVKAGLARL